MAERTYSAVMTAASTAGPDVVYDLLTDLRSHLVWAGRQQMGNYRLVALESPPGEARVGTSWTSRGLIPMTRHRWEDRSVVITADRPSVFEFMTEGRVAARRPMTAACLNRYLIAPDGDGCRVTHEIRVVEVTNPLLRLRFPMRPLVFKLGIPMSSGRGLRNLLRMAEKRSAGLAVPGDREVGALP